jgi:uncharacterized protein
MTQSVFAHGVRAIDCTVDARWKGDAPSGEIPGISYRDNESASYVHPAQHLFASAADRIVEGDTPETLVALMDRLGVERAMLGYNPDKPGRVLECLQRFPTRFFAKLYVDPHRGMDALRMIERVVREVPLIRALAMTPMFVQRPPNDKVYYPVYVKAIELGLPITINVGLPGPRVPGECQNPIYLDEVLYFFPELVIVMAHGGEPWEAMCVKLMLKWPNLYYYTSAFAPKYYPRAILDYANTRGADKVFFAGYHPALPMERLQREMQDVPLKAHVWPKFLRENAIRVFKLEGA